MRRNGRILAINGVLVLALGAAGWGAYVLLRSDGSGEAATDSRTIPVSRTTVVETVSAAGSVRSAYTADVDFGTAGTVAAIGVKVGDAVAPGQQLATLDDAEAKAKVKSAQSSLDAAEEDLANFSESDTGSPTGSGQTESALRAKVDQAELALQQAKDALAATVLTAPGGGTVTAINGSVGQRVGGSATGSTGTGQTDGGFIVLTDLSNLLVEANVAEIDVSKVKAGQEATVTINALPDAPVPATVAEVDLTPTTTNNIVQFGVSLTLAQPPAGLRPGQSASVAITVAKADNALAVPSAAVQTAGDQATVTVRSAGQDVTRAVEVGVRSEALVQITAGLTEGEQVVLTVPSLPSGGGGAGNARLGGGGAGGVAPGGVLVPPGGGR